MSGEIFLTEVLSRISNLESRIAREEIMETPSLSSAISGSGAAGQVAFFTGAQTISSDPGLTYSGSNLIHTETISNPGTTYFFHDVELTVSPSATLTDITSALFAKVLTTGSQNITADSYAGYIQYVHNGTGTVTTARGLNLQVFNFNTGAITTASGGLINVVNASSGNIATARGFHGLVDNAGSGTITAAIAVLAEIQRTGVGAITNAFGVYIVVPAAAGTIYGLYQQDSFADNYFAGDVGIATASPGSTLDVAGSFQCNSITNDTGLAAGTYTPTSSAAANLAANPTMTEAQYLRVGNTVTVSGRFTADPTAAGAASFELTLPVASNIGAAEDAAGVAFSGSIAGQGAEITGSVANNTAIVSWVAVDITSQLWSYTFSYQVI